MAVEGGKRVVSDVKCNVGYFSVRAAEKNACHTKPHNKKIAKGSHSRNRNKAAAEMREAHTAERCKRFNLNVFRIVLCDIFNCRIHGRQTVTVCKEGGRVCIEPACAYEKNVKQRRCCKAIAVRAGAKLICNQMQKLFHSLVVYDIRNDIFSRECRDFWVKGKEQP